ncbi:MAG: glycosyltransferase family 4 protein [Terrimicrobiaceae bacterium]
MRIAFAMINCNRRDGSARPVNEVAERLARKGHEVHLFARKAEDLDLGLVRWHRIPGPGWPEVADFSSYHLLANRRFRHREFDVVHSIGCNTVHADVVTIQNIQPAKQEIIRQFGGAGRVSPPRQFTRWLYHLRTCAAEKALYNRGGTGKPLVFLPVSHGVERELRRFYAIGSSPVRIIPNAADTGKFRPLEPGARVAWRVGNGFAPTDFLAIFSGGEWARKGLEPAIRAIASIDDPRAKLFVAGDDPGRRRFHQLAAGLGVADRVRFGGFRTDIAEVLGAGDVFLFPSHYEAFSLATIEASACGLPVFAPQINGTEDLIRPGVNGDFIARDPLSIGACLRELMARPDAVRDMGVNARRIVEENYTWDRVAMLTEEAYTGSVELRKEARET